MNHMMNRIALFTVLVVFASCATTPRTAQEDSRTPPLWVTDLMANTRTAYPNSEWLYAAVQRERDAKAAESEAVTALAQIFRVDLDSVTVANRQYVQAVGKVSGKATNVSIQASEVTQELRSASVISGLIGLQVESWTNPRDGRAYANARMNRKECSARYAAMIRENENVISQLKKEAEDNPGTFEAYELLNLAYSVALVTDNFHSLLTVLDTSAISSRPSYGNAEAVRSLARLAAQSIIITVKVEGDVGGRIEKAFSDCITSKGFRTNAAGNNPYTLSVSFALEDVDLGNPRYIYARYVLNYSLKNRQGVEILAKSENDRDGHTRDNPSEARQKVIRAAEKSIGSTGFASNIDAYMASLL